MYLQAILHCSATFSLCFVLYTANIISYLLSVLDFSIQKITLLETSVLKNFFFLLYSLKKVRSLILMILS